MLHAVKKKVALVATNTNAPAEFLDYKQRLANIKKNIQTALAGMDECNKHWMKGIADQRNFSTTFAEGYPMTHDDTYSVAMKFAQGARDRHDHFTRYSSPEDVRYHRMIEQLHGYVEEIVSIENMYPSLIEAKSEADRYQSKLDSMEQKKVSDEKISRNIVKHDNEHDRYVTLASEVVEAQKRAYAKAPIAHKMMLLAYWHANSRHVNIANKSLESTSDWVRSNEEDVLATDLANMDVHDLPNYTPSSQPYAATPTTPVGLQGVDTTRHTPLTRPLSSNSPTYPEGHHSHLPHSTTPVGLNDVDTTRHTPLTRPLSSNSPTYPEGHHSHLPHSTTPVGLNDVDTTRRTPLTQSLSPTHSPSYEGRHSHLPDVTNPLDTNYDRDHTFPTSMPHGNNRATDVETIHTPTGTTVIEKTRLPTAPGATEQEVIVKATATEHVRVPTHGADRI